MYRVMVVDDEPWGRRSLRKLIDEFSAVVEVVAEAKHGEEALQLIQISKPHIVVTDMNMPVMDGKAFLEQLFTIHKEIKVIVSSGYSEFEYLKAALTYQVCDYVLKPVSITDLRSAIDKAIEALHKDGDLLQQRHHAMAVWKLQREVFLQHVANERIVNQSDMWRQAHELKIAQAFEAYCVVILAFRQFREVAESKFHGNADLLMFSLENMLAEMIQSEAPLVFTADDRMKLCVIMPIGDDGTAYMRKIVSEFQQAACGMLKIDTVIGVSSEVSGIEAMPKAYDEALAEVWNNPFHGSGLSASFANSTMSGAESVILSNFDMKTIKQAVVSKNDKEMRSLLELFVQRIAASKHIRIQEVHYAYTRLSETIASGMKEIAVPNQPPFDYQALHQMMELQGLTYYMAKMTAQLAETFQHCGAQDAGSPVKEITDFLQKHYFEELSLVDVATRFHMDPSYLSKLFKAVTNENFIEYLTRLRMEKACELLRASDRKVNDISELVGYENQRYFSHVFKKFTGQTPSEYRESCGTS
ncbi:hypothetical protein BC351_17465 [Paenibacillus ferrarius]|uniref:DNA-binding response regulator n=1 Tax=Paenibacillus ferrarius TaxID=1469647 RepID=A0A1V4HPU7_9BACL|nr:helix-turn-helix domain-containing protein [Paenibacillus ferrarius]OPH60287.1 hypothetical protein BC351_17465 [Paenibacillus ferrarius]